MEKNQKAANPRQATSRNTRPTIGFILANMTKPWELLPWQGAADAVQERDANLICFAGGMLRNPEGFNAQANVLYDLVNPEQMDGLVICSGILNQSVSQREIEDFMSHYRPLPIVSIGFTVDGIPDVLMDNYQGMREAIIHLIEVHGYRRIAFVRGPEDHSGMQERYRAYTETLAEYGLAFNPNLVIPMIKQDQGEALVTLLLDERKLRPQDDVEAVAAASDNLALTMLKALQQRGIRAPDDVAVIGFGNREGGKVITPPLTTVQPSFYEMGRQAVEMLLARLRGEQVPARRTLAMKLVVRQSCGCLEPIVAGAAAGPVVATEQPFETAFAARREKLLSEIAHVVGDHDEALEASWSERLLNAFSAEMTGELTNVFLPAVEEVLHQVAAAGGDVGSWQGAISVLRRHALSCLGDDRTLLRAENLWGQTRVLIEKMAQQVQESRRLQAERQAYILSEIGRTLITTFDEEELMDVLARELPQLDIPSCYLALYENPEAPAEWSRLMLAYNEAGRIEVEPGSQRFPSCQLMPKELRFSLERQFNLVVEPLYFREDQIGLALFEAGSREGEVYETLRAQLSGALKGAQLLQQHIRAQDILALRPLINEVMRISKQLGNTSNKLTQISDQMAAEAEQTSRQALIISSNSRQINQVVHDVSTATEKEAASIQEISHSVTKVTEIIMNAMDIANTANRTMNALKTYSQQIGDIINVITNVAKRTKFLALYAAIEAAKVQEFGQGFAVVAGEVKKLALETSSSVKDIAYKLGMIQTSGQEAADAITKVVEIVGQVSELANVITAAISEQTATTNEISRRVADAVSDNDEITRAMTDVAAAAQDSSTRAARVQREAQELFSLAEQLHRLVEEFKM